MSRKNKWRLGESSDSRLWLLTDNAHLRILVDERGTTVHAFDPKTAGERNPEPTSSMFVEGGIMSIVEGGIMSRKVDFPLKVKGLPSRMISEYDTVIKTHDNYEEHFGNIYTIEEDAKEHLDQLESEAWQIYERRFQLLGATHRIFIVARKREYHVGDDDGWSSWS